MENAFDIFSPFYITIKSFNIIYCFVRTEGLRNFFKVIGIKLSLSYLLHGSKFGKLKQ